MNKKFKFKLSGLLTLREFKEKKIKNELGEILKEISQTKQSIENDENDIIECYAAQEEFLKKSVGAQMAQFFPLFIKTKRDSQEALGNMLGALERSYGLKLKELATAKGEVKVLDNLKEKKENEFDKKIARKFQETQEEFVMIKRYREKHL